MLNSLSEAQSSSKDTTSITYSAHISHQHLHHDHLDRSHRSLFPDW